MINIQYSIFNIQYSINNNRILHYTLHIMVIQCCCWVIDDAHFEWSIWRTMLKKIPGQKLRASCGLGHRRFCVWLKVSGLLVRVGDGLELEEREGRRGVPIYFYHIVHNKWARLSKNRFLSHHIAFLKIHSSSEWSFYRHHKGWCFWTPFVVHYITSLLAIHLFLFISTSL